MKTENVKICPKCGYKHNISWMCASCGARLDVNDTEKMKNFKINVSGYTVTNENFLQVSKEIHSKHGICPALNTIVMAIVSAQEIKIGSRKILNAEINKAIKLIGFSPKYFTSCLMKIGTEY